MKKRRIIVIISLFVLVFLVVFSIHNRDINIDKVLESDAYSYLPKEAKNYIEKMYENTGEVILTEKNKEENVPYLNPKFVEYLSMSSSSKEEIGDIPEVYLIDYISNEGVDGDIPSKYDLRNISGNSYISPLKNQGSLDICWDFATLEQIESLLMVKNKSPYNSSSKLFSTRQLDYATSTDGIVDYTNENGNRALGSGGNFFVSSIAGANAISLVDDNYMPFNNSKNKLELSKVLNYDNSKYEIDSTIAMPNLDYEEGTEEFDNYINTVKKYIMQYGGAYVGSQSPIESCGSKNSDNNYIIKVDDSCLENSGHAMQIIGWDDNYSYSYCKNGSSHSSNTSGCSSNNLVNGTGAWLLRNSWGSSNSYIYLAYDSLNSSISFTTSLSDMGNKTWDNNYHETLSSTEIWYYTSDSQSFTKSIDTDEKIEKVKFYSYGQNGEYKISVTSDTKNYSNILEFNVDMPGIHTIDLSDKNIIITDPKFNVEIKSTNNTNLIIDSMSVFTSNVDSSERIKTSGIYQFNLSSNNYIFRVYSILKNIKSNQYISYNLYNDIDEDVSSYLTVSNNVVSKNDVNSLINIDHSIPEGRYTLKASYGNTSEDITVEIGDPSYKVYYYSNYGLGSTLKQKFNAGEEFVLDKNRFTRLGYLFDKWNTKSDGSGVSYTDEDTVSLESSIYLYAIWKPITYKIRYHANGAEGSMDDDTFSYNSVDRLSRCLFTKAGYVFKEWNTKSDGSGTSYENMEGILNLTSDNDKIIDLYAIWGEVEVITSDDYTINYNKKYIDLISANTLSNSFYNKLNIVDGYVVQIDINGNSIIYTGSKTKIFYTNSLYSEYTNIVRGDVNGDGKISALDYVKIKNHIMESNIIKDDAYKLAADANRDEKISALDYVRIKNIIMNGE